MMDDVTIEVKLGAIRAGLGTLHVSLVVNNDGRGHVQLFALDSDARRSGVLLPLGAVEYQNLKSMIATVDEAIDRVRAGGQMRALK